MLANFTGGKTLIIRTDSATFYADSDPAAVAIQVSHRHHCVANGYAAHGAACGHDDAGQVEAEDDGGCPPKEVKLGELVLQRVERRG